MSLPPSNHDSDLDDLSNDDMQHLLPWIGGNIPNTELGYYHDMIAMQNEPLYEHVSRDLCLIKLK